MNGYGGTNNPVRFIPSPGADMGSPIEEYARFRNGKRYRRVTVRLEPYNSAGFADRAVMQTDGTPVHTEAWQVYSAAYGGTGYVEVYHDSQTNSGFATLLLECGAPPVEYPGTGDNDNGTFWFLVNRSSVAVVVSLFWRAWS